MLTPLSCRSVALTRPVTVALPSSVRLVAVSAPEMTASEQESLPSAVTLNRLPSESPCVPN